MMVVPARLQEPVADGADTEGVARLAAAAARGDRQAFALLVARYQRLVISLAFGLARRFGQGEEIAQEAFLTAWRRLPDLRDPTKFGSFLYGITYNICRNVRRKPRLGPSEAGGPSRSVADVPGAAPTPLDALIRREEERLLWQALARIPEPYRVPLVLIHRDEESIDQVADALGLTPEAVRQRLSRGRRLLREEMLSLLGSVRARTRPGRKFTAAIVLAISAARRDRPPSGRLQVAGGIAPVLGAMAMLLAASTDGPSSTERRREEMPIRSRVRDDAATFERSRPPRPARPASSFGGDLMALDFEDGAIPAAVTLGVVVGGPPRPGSAFAVMATVMAWYPSPSVAVIVDPVPGTFRRTLVLSFDYWAAADTPDVSVYLRDETQGRNYCRAVRDVVRERWAHVDLRLSALRPSFATGSRPPQDEMGEGDRLGALEIFGGRVGGLPFYVDNLRIADLPDQDLADGSDGRAIRRLRFGPGSTWIELGPADPVTGLPPSGE